MDNKNYIKKFDDAIINLCPKIQALLNSLPLNIKALAQEIRLKSNKHILIVYSGKFYILNPTKKNLNSIDSKDFIINPQDLNECFKTLCNYSVYSFQEQIKNGFITTKNGNRIGICGTAVFKNGEIYSIKNITSLNIRIAKEFKDCSKEIWENIKNENSGILIAGPPGCGKTTILRDLGRIISNNESSFKKLTIVDERMEICSAFEGIPQFDIGFSDVLSGFPKSEGFSRALRTLSPDTIICDEIGSSEDAETLTQCLNAGVQIIASIHARNLFELINRPQAKKILKSGAFEKIIFIDNAPSPGTITNIYKVCDINDKNYRNNNSTDIRNFKRINNIRKIFRPSRIPSFLCGIS